MMPVHTFAYRCIPVHTYAYLSHACPCWCAESRCVEWLPIRAIQTGEFVHPSPPSTYHIALLSTTGQLWFIAKIR